MLNGTEISTSLLLIFSLCQVSNEGYLAFAEADKAMDIIRLSTYQVRDDIQ